MDAVPIYCINLDAAPARWERVQRRLAAYGLAARRWRASTPADAAACGRAFVPYLSERQRACALSHYLLWEHCAHEGYDRVLILEDDAVFRKDWVSVVEGAPAGWSALFLNVAEEGPNENWFRAASSASQARPSTPPRRSSGSSRCSAASSTPPTG